MTYNSISPEMIKDTIQIYNESEYSLLLHFTYAIAPKNELSRIQKDAVELMAINHPAWDPDGPPQILGRFWVMYLEELYKEYISKRISLYTNEIKEAICVKFEFCKKLKNGTLKPESVDLAIAICDSLITYATNFPLPAAMTSVYIVKNQLLPLYCKCRTDNH